MRELTLNETNLVSGADCVAGNTYGGIVQPSSVGDEIIAIYEGLIQATSYMFERVANAL